MICKIGLFIGHDHAPVHMCLMYYQRREKEKCSLRVVCPSVVRGRARAAYLTALCRAPPMVEVISYCNWFVRIGVLVIGIWIMPQSVCGFNV